MFSATLHSDEVKDIASRICQDPSLVDLKVRLTSPFPSFPPRPSNYTMSGQGKACPMKTTVHQAAHC